METDVAVAPVKETAPVTTEEAVLRIVREVLGRPDVQFDDDVFDQGATSLSFVRILAQINRDLNVAVAAAALGGVATPRNIAANGVPGPRSTAGPTSGPTTDSKGA
jgi:hypothetical protein